MELFDRVVDKNLLVRRINICVAHLVSESEVKEDSGAVQLSLFEDYEVKERERAKEKASLDKERSRQEAILSIRKKYGKNSILRGISYTEGATAREIGGHKK